MSSLMKEVALYTRDWDQRETETNESLTLNKTCFVVRRLGRLPRRSWANSYSGSALLC